MQELLLVNPRTRAKSRKPRSAAQKAATRRLVALNKGRSANPKKRRTKRRVARAIAVASNPIHKRRAARRRNPAPRVHRRARRRNPISLSKPLGILKPALIGAIGATAVNTAINQIGGYLPAALMTGNTAILTRAVGAFGLAMIAGKLGMKGAMVRQMAEGSLTVTLHDAITGLAASAGIMSVSGMRGMRMYMPGIQAGAAPRLAGMNAYASGPGSITALRPQSQGQRMGMSF